MTAFDVMNEHVGKADDIVEFTRGKWVDEKNWFMRKGKRVAFVTPTMLVHPFCMRSVYVEPRFCM